MHMHDFHQWAEDADCTNFVKHNIKVSHLRQVYNCEFKKFSHRIFSYVYGLFQCKYYISKSND
jgi:hypothetical protein